MTAPSALAGEHTANTRSAGPQAASAESLSAWGADRPYWHGGAPGRAVGELLLPPLATLTPHVLSAYECVDASRPGYHADRVYVATERKSAEIHAALFPGGGWLYRVLPWLQLEADPDCDDPTFSQACRCARVLEVVQIHPADVVRILECTLNGGMT